MSGPEKISRLRQDTISMRENSGARIGLYGEKMDSSRTSA